MKEAMIRIENLTAVYGRGAKQITALQEVSLEIQAGEIFGLLGPNGAGKTTLLSCLEGLHKPSQGRALVAGMDLETHALEIKRMLGIQLQQSHLLDYLKVKELVEVYAALYKVFLSKAEIHALLAQFELADLMNRLGRKLSGGQAQRLALALALATNSRIVLLDEPTEALDPQARRNVWAMIRKLHDQGRTVILTTHAMEEAEALCGRVAIIHEGRVAACDTPAKLIANLGANPVLRVGLDVPGERVQRLPGVQQAHHSGQYLEVETSQPQATLAALQELAVGLGRSLGDVMLRQPNLEDVFLKLTGSRLNN